MISTGNDIVSLDRINVERTNEFRFYTKILDASEKELFHPIQLQIPFTHYVWLLWSVKEAAYKFVKRLDSDIKFSPLKFVVTELHPDTMKEQIKNRFFTGRIIFQQKTLFFNTEYNHSFLHTIVHHKNNFDTVFTGYATQQSDVYEQQSIAAKQLLQKDFSHRFNQLIHVEKNAVGYPEIYCNEKKSAIPVSISHDGFLVGYSCVVE